MALRSKQQFAHHVPFMFFMDYGNNFGYYLNILNFFGQYSKKIYAHGK